MRHIRFEIPIYDYTLILLALNDADIENGCDDKLCCIGVSEQIRKIVHDECEEGSCDGAITFHSSGNHQIVSVFYPMRSTGRARECFMHELYHIVTDIAKTTDIDSEAGAYLQGYIGELAWGLFFQELSISDNEKD